MAHDDPNGRTTPNAEAQDSAQRDALRDSTTSPAGDVELTSDDLGAVAGGTAYSTEAGGTLGCCNGWTNPHTCATPCN